MKKEGLSIFLISVHGLIRKSDLELGRDSDTGGQIKYVIELIQCLSKSSQVKQVSLLTRLIQDPKVSYIYSQARENLNSKAKIVRFHFGPKRYLRKEVLWPYLDDFVDQVIQYIRQESFPDIIHAHYADAGYVGSRLSRLLGIPLIYTGHSLGRVKKKNLLKQGLTLESIEKQFNFNQRIEAEEITLDTASKVIVSSKQEMEEQYSLYDNYNPKQMVLIQPGIMLDQFYPPGKDWDSRKIEEDLSYFLKDTSKSLILSISRPDFKKNIQTLIEAYGSHKKLKEHANLVIITGNRKDIKSMEKNSREVMVEILLLIDYYNLYGNVAYPKGHDLEDIPNFYRLTCQKKGVFINPALNEPFGLTLIEASASGLPILATKYGGAKEIIQCCENGLLIDPLNKAEIGESLYKILTDQCLWEGYSDRGTKKVRRYFSWGSHIKKYIEEIYKILENPSLQNRGKSVHRRLVTAKYFLICDIDNTLIGDRVSLEKLIEKLKKTKSKVSFGIATGRSIESSLEAIEIWKIPMPDVLITSVGSEIYYGPNIIEESHWDRHIRHRWFPDSIRGVLDGLSGLVLQGEENQKKHKISYFIDPEKAPSIRKIKSLLRQNQLSVNVIYSCNQYLDILPIRASKGLALRYFAMRWGLLLDHILVAGDSGNDIEMLKGQTWAIVVGNYIDRLDKLKFLPNIYFAKGHYAEGILEGIKYYEFFPDDLE